LINYHKTGKVMKEAVE